MLVLEFATSGGFLANNEVKALFVVKYPDNMEIAKAGGEIPAMLDGLIGSIHSGQTNSPKNRSRPNQ